MSKILFIEWRKSFEKFSQGQGYIPQSDSFSGLIHPMNDIWTSTKTWCHNVTMSWSIESIASLVKKEVFLGGLYRNVTETMLGKAVSIYSACRDSIIFTYGLLPENNELWPSPLWWLQIFMLRKETSPSACRALQRPPETEVGALFFGIISGSYGNCPDVLNSAIEQHSWGSWLYLQSLIPGWENKNVSATKIRVCTHAVHTRAISVRGISGRGVGPAKWYVPLLTDKWDKEEIQKLSFEFLFLWTYIFLFICQTEWTYLQWLIALKIME